jgi:hypothetical protein
MATQADVIRSVTAILQSGERKQQYEVQTALSMMQIAQQKKMQDITIAKSNLELAGKSLEQQKPQIAASFLQSTGLGGIWQEAEEGETTGEVISDMAKRLRHKSYFGKKFDQAQAESIAGAVWSYYSAEDPNAVLSIASNLHDSVSAIEAGEGSISQKKMFEAFNKLGIEADMKDITLGAKKARQSEQYISKEISEFLQGDYDIQSPIGVYADVPAQTDAAMLQKKIDDQPESSVVIGVDQTREALRLVESKFTGLEKKIESGVATDEEKEEYYTLPSLIERYRSDLIGMSDELDSELDLDIQELSRKIDAMERGRLTALPEYTELKSKLSDKRSQKRDLSYENRAEQLRKRKAEDISIVSEETGIPESQVRASMSELDPRRDYGFGAVYPGMARAPEGRAGEEWTLKPEGGLVGARGREFLDLLESIGLYNASKP